MNRLSALILVLTPIGSPVSGSASGMGADNDAVAAMRVAMASPAPKAPAASQQNDGQVHVFLLGPSGRVELKTGQIAASTSNYRPSPLQFTAPTTIPITMQYDLKGAHADVTTQSSPSFEMDVANVPFIDPAHFEPVIIRLSADGADQRRFATQTSHVNTHTSTNTLDPIADDRVPVKVDTIAPGRLRITPLQPLATGEYGVAMRDPDAQAVTYANNTSQAAEGMSKQQTYQTMVWDFSVQP